MSGFPEILFFVRIINNGLLCSFMSSFLFLNYKIIIPLFFRGTIKIFDLKICLFEYFYIFVTHNPCFYIVIIKNALLYF